MKTPRRILRQDTSAVSEVIGTILILGITVALFSVIIIWVTSFTGPAAGIRLDLDGNLVSVADPISGDPAGLNITVIHRGGEALSADTTRVYLTIERDGAFSTEILQLQGTIPPLFQWGPNINLGQAYGLIDGTDATWNINERWSITVKSLSLADKVTVSVVDIGRSLVIWTEQVLGPSGTHPPIFGFRWADSNLQTSTAETPETGKTFSVHARVTDGDDDLITVSANVTMFVGSSSPCANWLPMNDNGPPGDAVARDGVWTLVASCLNPQLSWDGSIILFHATDAVGHVTDSRMILKVIRGSSTFFGFGGTWNSTLGGIGQGASGPEGDYGYNIYDEEGLPTADNPSGTPTRFFSPGERVYVIARSTVVRNLENINSFILRDASGFKLVPPTKEFDSRDPTKIARAFGQTLTTPYSEYQYNFTAPLIIGAYGVEFTLKDNAGHAPFFATDRISVTVGGSAPVSYPRILTYRGPSNWDPRVSGVPSNLVLENTFRSTEIMYVRVFFKDLDKQDGSCSGWFPVAPPEKCPPYVNANAGDVEIQDYYGGFPVKKKPGASPVSSVRTYPYDASNEASYVFYIDLLRRSQDPWVPGTNYYSLRIRSLSDSGFGSTTPEPYQMLATSIQITAPLSTIDIVASTEEGPGQKGRGVYWYENEFYWREGTIDIIPKDGKKPTAMATGDLNGDTKVDVVVALDSPEITNIVAYYNLDYGVTWRREFINQFQGKDNYRAESVAIADLDGDGDGEIIAGIKDVAGGAVVGVIVFWNDGSWTGQELRYSEAGAKPNMQSIVIGDINSDGRPDIVSGDKNGIVNYYCNNVRGSWLAPKTTPCPTQASLQPTGAMESINKGVKVGQATEIPFNGLGLGQMEGFSFDLRPAEPTTDKTLDIIAANNQNIIIYRTKVTYDAADDAFVATFTRYDLLYSGDSNGRKIHSVAIGDMNADGRNDIVFGVDPDKEKSGVFRLRNMGMKPAPSTTFETWQNILLPHSIVDPKTGKIADLGIVKDLALGDTDGDGDLDIIYLNGNDPNDFLNNVWHYENVGDDKTTYRETNVFTDGWFKRKEKSFALDVAYIDL